ncbi:MAG: hypothetical protein JXA74_14530 [Anaerolineae bacterium]|nr:hypothetical protein [Anaerolineae bacterium]
MDPRTLAYFGVMLVLIWLAGWLFLHQASEVASYAHEINALMQRKERLHRELVVLRAEVALLGSLSRLQETGTEWGYQLPSASDQQRILRLEMHTVAAAPSLSSHDDRAHDAETPKPESSPNLDEGLWQTLRHKGAALADGLFAP